VVGGALAPLAYLLAVAIGGWLTPGYSHVAGAVSALLMTGAAAATVLIPLFALYNALLMAFAFAVRDVLHEHGVRLSLVAPIALAVTALLGALMLIYPMDPSGVPASEAGRMHDWFSGVAAVARLIAVFAAARSLREHLAWRGLAIYSYASLAVMIAAGFWAANATTEGSPWMGLAERVAMAAFLQWLFVFAVAVLRRRPSVA
jgi:hypothetical protein